MRTDSEIKKDAEDELRWDPDIVAADVAVAVRNGLVTLTGFVRSYMQRAQAERDVKRVTGTLGVANVLEVRLPFINKRLDPDIVGDAVQKLRIDLPYASQFIKVTVREAWRTLEGNLEWNYQRDRAEKAARSVLGVIGVADEIKLKPRVMVGDIKLRIEDALKRSTELDAGSITVDTVDSKATPTGTVRSWAERTEAERTAWQAPGVTAVENKFSLGP